MSGSACIESFLKVRPAYHGFHLENSLIKARRKQVACYFNFVHYA